MGKYLEQQYDEREYALELAKKHNLLPEDNSKMTWDELKEKAKELGTFFGASEDRVYVGKLEFDKDGGIYLNPFYLDDEVDVNFCIESDRTYDEMYAIMKALQ